MKICIVTATRAEYGLLRWIMHEIQKSPKLELQLIVTGGHLVKSQGYTFKHIENDGFAIDEKIDIFLSSREQKSLTKSMGILSLYIADALDRLKPDLIMILGDRYELLPVCSAALVQGLKIAHISGGDITEGAIDNKIRNAITHLSNYHFPGNNESAKRLKQLTCSNHFIYNVGEPGLDNILRIKKISKKELSKKWAMESNKKWIICTLHPETNIVADIDIQRAGSLVDFFTGLENYETMITAANMDFGGERLNEIFMKAAAEYSNIYFESSLGQKNYTNFLRHAEFMIGNSSSGIVEALSFCLPAINIGNRQKGRYAPGNVITIDGSPESLRTAYGSLEKLKIAACNTENPYGNGDTSIKIIKILEHIANNHNE